MSVGSVLPFCQLYWTTQPFLLHYRLHIAVQFLQVNDVCLAMGVDEVFEVKQVRNLLHSLSVCRQVVKVWVLQALQRRQPLLGFID